MLRHLPLSFLGFCSLANAQTRTVTDPKDGWTFQRGGHPEASSMDFDDPAGERVSVPHDWAITGPFDKEIDTQVVAIAQNKEVAPSEKTGRTGDLPHAGEGWYRNRFELPPYQSGQTVMLLFEGAMSELRVFLNGKKVGEWNYSYIYLSFDSRTICRSKRRTSSPSSLPTVKSRPAGTRTATNPLIFQVSGQAPSAPPAMVTRHPLKCFTFLR